MFKKILIGLVVLVAILVVVVMMQPSTYHVERTAKIDAPAEVVWAEISNFAQWKAWNPWEKMDPEQQTTITGEPGTVGHSSSWKGEKTGTGTMTITEAHAPMHVGMKLEFKEPMASTATSDLKIAAQNGSSEVTWSMDGENGFVGKFFGLIYDMDTMIGGSYDEGLANLKAIAEASAKKAAEAAAAEAAEGESEEAPAEGDEAPAGDEGDEADGEEY